MIIDTVSTNFGPGDESKNTDVAALLSNVNVNVNVNVGGRFHCAVIISHHVGHGDKDRERGAYAIRGNADARVLVQRTGDELGTALHCLKVKDGQEWAPIAFKGRVITIPGITDSEGEAATSLCLERVEYVPPAR